MVSESVAYTNIALIKYWCKNRYEENVLLPLVSSLSLRSKKLYTKTIIQKSDKKEFILNNIVQDDFEVNKIFGYINKIVGDENLRIISYNNMPTAAGLASSASGYASLIMALNEEFNLNLTKQKMAQLASMGSGSASRSFYDISAYDREGNVYEVKTDLKLGMLALVISKDKKEISSRKAMEISKETSPLLEKFVIENEKRFSDAKIALKSNDFKLLGESMEISTKLMHEVMNSSTPSIDYLKEESRFCIKNIENLRKKGMNIYWTTDAGPNVKVLYLKEEKDKIIDSINSFFEGEIIDVI